MASLSPLFMAVITITIIPLGFVLLRLIRQRSLWNIPGPASVSFVTGNLTLWFGHGAIPYQEKTADKYGRIIRLTGFLGEQSLSIADTKALYEVLIKQQDIFEESEYFMETLRLMLGRGLLSTLGVAHRKQRRLMNPAFSINHMRRMIPVFQSLTLQLQSIMRADIGREMKEVDIMEYTGRLAVELISQAGLGHTFQALDGKDNGYCLALKSLIPTGGKLAAWRPLLPLLTRNIPGRVLRFFGKMLPWPTLHQMMDISDTLQSTSQSIWEEKKRLHALGDKSVVNEYGEGKDIMSILLKANLAASESERLTDEELLAQINTFMLAGSDTTSNALSRTLYLLALHPEVQDKLRQELIEAGGEKGEIGYDDLVTLPYLEAVCRETLRFHPPIHFVQRDSRKDFVLPLAHPYTDIHGKEHNELFVPNGTTIYVNILGVNRDPAIWGPDANEWKPQRWLAPLPGSVTEARIPGVYANTLTFIGGSRACIGFKFSQLEMKVVLSQLVPSFRFAPSEKQEVTWRFGGIVTPSVKGSTTNKPELPLRVSVAD